MRTARAEAVVGSAELQKDLTDRLVKAGNPAKSVTCNEDLVGQVGKTAKCDVVFTDTNSVEAVFTATKVDGTSVSYEIAPELTKEQLQKAVGGLTTTASVACDSGLPGKVGATTDCEVVKDATPSKRTVEVEKVEGLSMDINVLLVMEKKKVEEVLAERLGAEGNPPETVDCVDDVVAKTGSTVECTASVGGQPVAYIVEVTSTDGDTVNINYTPKG